MDKDFFEAMQGKNYQTSDGLVKFTSAEAVHALKHFHEMVDLDRAGDVPYMLGIMGGCFAHACKWDDEMIAKLDSRRGTQKELFLIWAKMITAYFDAAHAGMFAHPNAGLS